MVKKKNAMSASYRKSIMEAREMQYGKDFRFYEAFARIWGWDGYETEPEKAVKRLGEYLKAEEKKANPQKELPQNPELQFYVGVAYLSGWIPCEDHEEKAAMWFSRSSRQGCDKGALGVGYIMENGLAGSDPADSYPMIVQEYTSAAKKGNVLAQYRLANLLHQMDPENPRLIQLLLNAADAGYKPAKELYRKVADQVKAAPVREERQTEQISRKQEPNYDEIMALLLEIRKNSAETVEIVRRVELSVQMMQSSLNGMWQELRESDSECAEKLDLLQQQVNSDLQKAAFREWAPVTYAAMEDAEKFMSVLFKNDWRNPARLCEASCDALVTAHVLMQVADKLEIKNYAGIVITAVWALEHECRRRFFDAFHAYLDSVNVPREERLARMNLKPGKDGEGEFTLGSVCSVTYGTSYSDFSRAYPLLSDAAKQAQKKMGYDEGQMIYRYWLPGTYRPEEKKGKPFKDMIKTLNAEYRVPAAHAQEITKGKAAECCNLLGITEAHRKLDNVEGALQALLWLTAPLK